MIIIETFIKLREVLLMHKDIMHQLENVQNKLIEHDDQIMVIFEYLKQLENARQQESEHKNRRRIGFKPSQDSL